MTIGAHWKDMVRSLLPWRAYWKLKRLREEGRALFRDGDLTELAKIYKTDKWGRHQYTPVYQQWFSVFRHSPVRLLEIGVGGYKKPLDGGDSLRMWKRFFEKGRITSIDMYDKSALREDRIHIYQGDQADKDFLLEVHQKEGPFDIIIDDGSHMQSHLRISFETLFPLMANGGLYVIEDTQTSYWPKYEGSTREMHSVDSIMNYFIQRVHALNQVEWIKEDAPDLPANNEIDAIAFYHNLIFIQKTKSKRLD